MTTRDQTPANDCPADVLGWIPWYPDGLEAPERGAVEAHAASCPACRQEIEMLQGGVEHGGAPEPERIYAQVLARMEATPPAGESRREEEDARPVATVSHLPVRPHSEPAPRQQEEQIRGWRRISRVQSQRGLAVAAGLLMALAMGSWMAAPPDTGTDAAVYETASVAAGVAEGGASLEVVFRESASAAEINRALHALGARITGGPSQLGVYRLELGTDADITAAKKLLTQERDGVASFAGTPLHP